MIKTHKRIGSIVNFRYPKHGRYKTLRDVIGVVVDKGIGPNGPYLTVDEVRGGTRCFSTKKIVDMWSAKKVKACSQ
tara:strand:- start:199 stop:426 length:228 start_codon:yes stop_codon:yes gene_type:complete